MKKKLPYFCWWAAAAETDEVYTAMTPLEHSLYHRCLNRAWINEGIPADLAILARSIGWNLRDVQKAWPVVALRFEISAIDPSRLVDANQEEERSHAKLKSDRNAEVAKEAWKDRPRRKANADANAYASVDASAMPRASDCDCSSDCRSTSEKEENLETRETHEILLAAYHQLVELWEKPCECAGCEQHTFPSKDQDLGAQIWAGLVESGRITKETVFQVLEGLSRYRSSTDWHKNGGKFVMSIPSFLGWSKNGMPSAPRWNDKPQQKGEWD